MSVRRSWLPIATAPKDGTKIDVWIGRDAYRIVNGLIALAHGAAATFEASTRTAHGACPKDGIFTLAAPGTPQTPQVSHSLHSLLPGFRRDVPVNLTVPNTNMDAREAESFPCAKAISPLILLIFQQKSHVEWSRNAEASYGRCSSMLP